MGVVCFVAVFGGVLDLGAGFAVCEGLWCGVRFARCCLSGTFTEQVGGGLGWWWVVRVKFPDTLQSVVWDFMFCGLSRA